MLLQVSHEVLVLQVAQCLHRVRAGGVVGGAPRHLDPARFEEGCHAVIARLAVDVAPVVGLDVKGMNASRWLGVDENPSKLFHAAE